MEGRSRAGFVTMGQPNGALDFGGTQARLAAPQTPHHGGFWVQRSPPPCRRGGGSGYPGVQVAHRAVSTGCRPRATAGERHSQEARKGQEPVPWAISGWLLQVMAFSPLRCLAVMWSDGKSSQG